MSTQLAAQVIDTTWLGGTSSWHNASQWSGGVVPNNAGATTYHAFIPAGGVSVPAPAVTIDALDLDPPATLDIRTNFTVIGAARIDGICSAAGSSSSSITMTVGPAGSLTGTGTIIIGTATIADTTTLTSPDVLDIGSGVTVRARAGAIIGLNSRPLVNRGHIVGGFNAIAPQPIVAGSTFSNLGTIEASNGILQLGGTYTRANLGNLAWSSNGVFGIAGTLLNDNQTFVVDAEHPWTLTKGTVQGGTLEIKTTLGILPGQGGTLDNVVVNGRISHAGFFPLNIRNGTLAGNAEISLSPGSLSGSPRLISSSPTLTINSTALVRGGGANAASGPASGVGNGSGAVVNHGTIRSENFGSARPEFGLLGTSLFNDGMLAVGSTSFINAARDLSNNPTILAFGAGGMLAVDMSANPATGFLQVNGVLNLSTPGDALMLTAGPQIQPNTFYRIVTASGGVVGQFNSVTTNFQVAYVGNEIHARYVPEPTIVLSLTAAAALLRRRRQLA